MMVSKLVRGLGWFSIGLGLAEIMAPRTVSRFLGRGLQVGTVRAFGWREIAAGVGLLATSRTLPWLLARVAGDALDLAPLGPTLSSRNPKQGRGIAATAAVAGVTALDMIAARRVSQRKRRSRNRR